MTNVRFTFTFFGFIFLAVAFFSFVLVAFLDADVEERKNYWQAKSEFPFDKPLSGLTNEEEDNYIIGRSFFTIPWVEAPSATTARDGLGPLFNANTCAGCHFKRRTKDIVNENGGVSRTLVFKLGRPDKLTTDEKHLLLHDDNYGGQISIHGTKNNIFEAKPNVKVKYKTIRFADSQEIKLRYFEPYLTNLNYGKLNDDSKLSLRLAITLVGLGLIKKITPELILQYADENDQDNDGISGKANWVLNPENGEIELGKYGYKASQSTITMQSADAAFHDMSLSNPLFPKDNCANEQTACANAPKGLATDVGGNLELPMLRLKGISSYLQSLKAPPPYNKNHKGFRIFKETGCASCHRVDYQVSKHLEVSPFSDFLLHDMGDELADSRYEMEATPREWRTAPLWGMGGKLRAGIPLLHDGRATSLQQAVLWHGGEGEKIKQNFIQLNTQERELLINFLESL